MTTPSDDMRDELRVMTAIDRLENGTGKPIRYLLRLAEAWGRPERCRVPVGWQPPRRTPTERGIAAVVRWLPHANEHVARAALCALSKGRQADGRHAATVAMYLTHEDPLRRILAARTLCHLATATERDALIAATLDPLFTVRWYAAGALARLGACREAVEVLAAAIPRRAVDGSDIHGDVHFDEWLGIVRQVLRSDPSGATLADLAAAVEQRGAMTAARATALRS